jgi:SAM-dependent methyltransferase
MLLMYYNTNLTAPRVLTLSASFASVLLVLLLAAVLRTSLASDSSSAWHDGKRPSLAYFKKYQYEMDFLYARDNVHHFSNKGFRYDLSAYPATGMRRDKEEWRLRSQEELVRAFARFAGLKDAQYVVDVGSGKGWQDKIFIEEFGVKEIHAYDISGVLTRDAKQKFKQEWNASVPEGGFVGFYRDDAIELTGEPSNDATACVCIESAMHFLTREFFFRRVFDVLKGGSVFALTDILPISGYSGKTYSKVQRTWQLENDYDILEYRQKLIDVGFVQVEFWDVTPWVDEWPANPRNFAYKHQAPAAYAGGGGDDFVWDKLRYYMVRAVKPFVNVVGNEAA